jgi:hypothetical protein
VVLKGLGLLSKEGLIVVLEGLMLVVQHGVVLAGICERLLKPSRPMTICGKSRDEAITWFRCHSSGPSGLRSQNPRDQLVTDGGGYGDFRKKSMRTY